MQTSTPTLKGAALALAVAGLMAGNAQAGVLAQSVLEITNLLFLDADTGVALNESDFTTLIANDSTDATATLNNVTANDSDSVNTFPFTLDLAQQCVGGCAGFAENDYSHRPPGYDVNVARADTLLQGTPLNFDVSDGGTGATGADAHVVGESELISAGDSTTQANLGLQADFELALAEDTAVTFTFDALGYLIAFLGPQAVVPGSSAQASYNWSLNITDADTGDDVFAFSPDGNLNAGAGENADPCSLNDTVSRLVNGTSTDECNGSFSATTGVLTAGTLYNFSIRHSVASDATKVTVPEPATLALLGVGLMGLAGVYRKRGSKA